MEIFASVCSSAQTTLPGGASPSGVPQRRFNRHVAKSAKGERVGGLGFPGLRPHILFLGVLCVLAVSFPALSAQAEQIPRMAKKYLPRIVREANFVGLDSAIVAGQVHQESGFNPSANSGFAFGLAQFTPETETTLKRLYPKELGTGGASSPGWAIRAMVRYDRYLLDRLADSWPLALRAYNGGLGWIQKERAFTTEAQRHGETGMADVLVCGEFRSAASCRENLEYPRRILDVLAPMYRAVINPFQGEKS